MTEAQFGCWQDYLAPDIVIILTHRPEFEGKMKAKMPLNKTFYMIKYDFKEPEQNWSIGIKENLTVLQEITRHARRLIVISFSMATRLGNA